jgi:L-ascorbate metabolism protein UlaG (beta-lactamase superfamily)
MKFTYYGHSCFAVEIADQTILFDPFITPNELAREISLDQIKADYILISHGHFDHISDAVDLAKRTGATVISNFEIVTWLGKQGIAKTHPMNHGGGRDFDFGRVKYVAAVHSSQLPDGTYGGNPGGFVIGNSEGSFYYAGDTALTRDMKLIGDEFDLRFAVLPIGDNFTMGTKDAIRATDFIKCKSIVGVHYDTFPPIKIDRAVAEGAFAKAGLKLHLPAIGETINL